VTPKPHERPEQSPSETDHAVSLADAAARVDGSAKRTAPTFSPESL
jgi:hypothetical protein